MRLTFDSWKYYMTNPRKIHLDSKGATYALITYTALVLYGAGYLKRNIR